MVITPLLPCTPRVTPCCRRYLRCSKDVQFNSDILKYALGETNYWNYIYHNGPGSLFSGYMWSLDVFVDYAWAQLGTLNNVLVVLLIVEVRRSITVQQCGEALISSAARTLQHFPLSCVLYLCLPFAGGAAQCGGADYYQQCSIMGRGAFSCMLVL